MEKGMFRLAIFWVVLLFSSVLQAQSDYEISRLPNSTGKYFTDVNGNQRFIVPTFISDNGVLAGMRLTWKASDGGGADELVAQSGYLYDLNSGAYIAQNVGGFPITQVTNSDYISKRLHPNGQRWQTWRCPISSLTPRASNPAIHDNPDCVLLDNDYLDQTPNNGEGSKDAYWASWFIGINIMYTYSPIVNNRMAVNTLGTTYVMDMTDDAGHNPLSQEPWGGHLYRSNGQVILQSDPLDSVYQALINDGVDVSKLVGNRLGQYQGKDAYWFFTDYEPTQLEDGSEVYEVVEPAKVYQVLMEEDNSVVLTSIVLNRMNPESGYYVRPVSISKDGIIVTDMGVCSFSTGCTEQPINGVMPNFSMDPSSGEFLMKNNTMVGAHSDGSGIVVYDFNQSPVLAFDIEEEAENKFLESFGNTGFVFPFGPGFNRTHGKSIHWSNSGEHIVLFGKLESGQSRIYYYKRK